MSATLADLGHDTLSAVEKTPGVSDEALLTLAMRERRVLITLDKDFGELVFVRRLPHPCIIRFVGMKVCDDEGVRHGSRHGGSDPTACRFDARRRPHSSNIKQS